MDTTAGTTVLKPIDRMDRPKAEAAPAFFLKNIIINPFRAPKPLPILNPSNNVPKNGFPIVKGSIVLSSDGWGKIKIKLTEAREPYRLFKRTVDIRFEV